MPTGHDPQNLLQYNIGGYKRIAKGLANHCIGLLSVVYVWVKLFSRWFFLDIFSCATLGGTQGRVLLWLLSSLWLLLSMMMPTESLKSSQKKVVGEPAYIHSLCVIATILYVALFVFPAKYITHNISCTVESFTWSCGSIFLRCCPPFPRPPSP